MIMDHALGPPPGKIAIIAEKIFDGEAWREHCAALVEGRRFIGVAKSPEVGAEWVRHELPAKAFLAPGFIDLQVNGGSGVLLNDQPNEAGLRAIAHSHRRFGTTACLPTLISDRR